MIGRGIFHNPFAFEQEPKDHSSEELLDLLWLHLDLYDQYSGLERRLFSPLQRFFKIYVRGFRGASELRNNVMNTKSTSEVRALLDEFGNKEPDGAEGLGD
ncbi:putative tRNA-dihydrouridine synthase [Paenibacillus pseudetheri]|uniref:tRNA-dihydrouridine synthase n=1 Tax=Paenibacillus pseudetheri TaxID=2897682 RepID=A0ABM9BLM5_9BACL|nr:putative tRNA-dihydrouridine synthase [Paenibacillus pseudetheri]